MLSPRDMDSDIWLDGSRWEIELGRSPSDREFALGRKLDRNWVRTLEITTVPMMWVGWLVERKVRGKVVPMAEGLVGRYSGPSEKVLGYKSVRKKDSGSENFQSGRE